MLFKMQILEKNKDLNRASLSNINFSEQKEQTDKNVKSNKPSPNVNFIGNLFGYIKNLKYEYTNTDLNISFFLGSKPNISNIENMDLSIDVIGTMLPKGEGNAIIGEELYRTKCISCHGSEGDSTTVKSSDSGGWSSDKLKLLYPTLSGGIGTLSSQMPVKTVGSYWPYATTLFDYIRRAMPPYAPQSLKDNEVYSLTAYILYTNNIVRKNQNLNDQNLAKIRMPNQAGFINSWGPEWWRQWVKNINNIIVTIFLLSIVLLIIIFGNLLVQNKTIFYSLRGTILLFSLVWLGWINSTQPGIKNTFSILQEMSHAQWNWAPALFEPLLIIVFVYTIFTTILFGRGLFCGWICPFGALQEILFTLSKLFKFKTIQISQNIDLKAKKLKYIFLFSLIGIIFLLPQYSFLNNIEPFDSLIELKLDKAPIYFLWLLIILSLSLIIQRPFCRYLCPSGAFLGILGKFQVLDWIKRRSACGISCNSCQPICPTSAISNKGNIIKSECISCLACQEMYYNKNECIVFKPRSVRQAGLKKIISESK